MSSRLTDALSVMLPAPQHTAFLRVCLLQTPALGGAWREWLGSVGGPLRFLRETGREMRRHLPLLYRNLADNGQDIPADLRPYLRGALVREQLRSQIYEQCLLESVQFLAAASVDFTVVKGAAVSRMLFQPPFLRHCHDLDLWVTEEDRLRAVAALAARGFTMGSPRAGTTPCKHPKGLPVLLHTRLLQGPYDRMPQEEMRARRRTIETPSGPWKVLAPPDMLLHCCAHASTATRRPHANWVVDAHRLSPQLAAGDWKRFLDLARRADLALPLLVLLRYLKDDLAAPVPLSVLDELVSAADRVESVNLMAAIDGAWIGRPGGVVAMLRKSGWRSRVMLVRWLLLPPPRYLRATRGSMGLVRLATEYPVRPVRFFVRSARTRSAQPPSGARPASISPAAVADEGSE